MQPNLILLSSCATVVLCAIAPRLVAQEQAQRETTVPRLKAYSWVKPGPGRELLEATKELMARDPSKTLPLWLFFTELTRDQNA